MMQFKKGLGWKASIGPPTDMVIDENYAELGTWTNIQTSGNVMSEELTDIAVDLWENEETREQRNKMKDRNNRIHLVRLSEEHTIAFKEEMQEAFQHGFEAYNKEPCFISEPKRDDMKYTLTDRLMWHVMQGTYYNVLWEECY